MIAIMLGATAPAAQAVTCRSLGVYTGLHWDSRHMPPLAPAIYIYNGPNSVRPDPSKMKIWYDNGNYNELVPSPSWDGVKTDAPWGENFNGGWYGYWIAGRWYSQPSHFGWDDDWRWHVDYCT